MTDNTRMPPPPDAVPPLDADQLARAEAALEAWYTNPDGSDFRTPEMTWTSDELHKMHAALEAPDVDSALQTFGAAVGTWLTSRELDAENRALMTQIRQRLGLDASGPELEDVIAMMAMSTPQPPRAAVSVRVAHVFSIDNSARDAESPTEPDL